MRGREQGIEQGLERGIEDQRAMLRRQAERKFGPATGRELARRLANVADAGRLTAAGDWIIDCDTGAACSSGSTTDATRAAAGPTPTIAGRRPHGLGTRAAWQTAGLHTGVQRSRARRQWSTVVLPLFHSPHQSSSDVCGHKLLGYLPPFGWGNDLLHWPSRLIRSGWSVSPTTADSSKTRQ